MALLNLVLRVKANIKSNPDFATLHDVVAAIFAKQLLTDKNALDLSNFFDISFAAKWCPSTNKSYNLRTIFQLAISTHLNVKDELVHIDEEKRAFALATKMRKEFLVPLKNALEIPKIYMSAKKQSEFSYERVLSVAMTNYVFYFLTWLPRRLCKAKANHRVFLQKHMVSDVKESGSKLSSSMAVCDVLGSMSRTLMEVCPWVVCGSKGS
ncbi:hypothetical protein L7F22_036286 [Adiantum nelumboides]|nr:hypothetical protein [Adiantum nelumboides]